MRLRTAYLLLASLVPASWAILEDEAYQIDYHHALLGTPQAPTTFFHKPSSSSSASLLLTLSEKLILGAVNPKDGLIVWRQNISDYSTETRSPGLLRAVNGEDTVVSALGSDVLAWGASDGKLAWRNRFEGSSVVDLELVETQRTGGTQAPRDAIILSRGKNAIVRRLGGASGSVKWGYSDDR